MSLWIFSALAAGLAAHMLCSEMLFRIRLRHFFAASKMHDDAVMACAKYLNARPGLYVSQCPYAQSLIETAIFAYESRAEVAHHVYGIHDEEWLQHLYDLLESPPPSSNPPRTLRGFFMRSVVPHIFIW